MSMTHEEAARILDPETSAEVLREYGDGNAQIAACDEACRIAADVLLNKPTGDPLTLEQLRDMDGQPVWIERNESPHDGKWFIVDHADIENPDRTLYTKEGVTYSDYGVHFTAYAYPPAHIDREAWEPCEVCGEKDPFGNPKFSHHFVVDESSLYFCDSDFGWEGEKIKFCPFCSRPLTEEAWAELEKRMGVMG